MSIIRQEQNQLATVSAPRAAHPENPVLLLHRYLRGRYPIAIVLAILLAIPGGFVGYFAVPPMYSSTGVVRIAPTLPRIMYTHDDNQVPPMFDSFVATQAALLSSPRVLDMAASSEELRSAGWPSGPEGVAQLRRALTVNNRRGTELITAQVEHQDPRLAQLAVNAVLTAYETVQGEMSGLTATDREQALRARQRELQREIESLRTQIADLARPFGSDDLDQLHSAKAAELARLDSAIADLEVLLPIAVAQSTQGEEAPQQAVPEVEMEQFARRDRTLGALVEQRLAIVTEIQSSSQHLGEGHRRMRHLERRRRAIDQQIEQRVAFLRENDVLPLPRIEIPGEHGEMSVSQIQDLLTRHRQMRDRLNGETLQIGRTRLTINAHKERLAERRQFFAETSRLLEQIELESRHVALGRISIHQRGDLPFSPSKDRRLPLAFFGFMAGIGLGTGFVAFGRLLRGDYRYIDELERSEPASILLGTVPDLDASDPEPAELAALSIHHVRNMLQLNAEPGSDAKVYAVSSAQAGDGKTSVALSLAMSFAATGSRTLLIDADLMGRGVSRQLGLTTRTGLREALHAAPRHDLNGELHETRINNLWALPSGCANLDAEQIARHDLRRVLEQARKQFDTVVVDTGPILGSLEANLVAPMSDLVVLVVSRGQSSRLVRNALDRLALLGATCGGLVFNRADVRDFVRSTSTVSVSARSLREEVVERSQSHTPAPLALMEAVAATADEPDPPRR